MSNRKQDGLYRADETKAMACRAEQCSRDSRGPGCGATLGLSEPWLDRLGNRYLGFWVYMVIRWSG